MPKLIVTSRYIKPNAHKRFGNYIKYIATRDGVEKTTQNHELDREIFMNYLDSHPNSHGLFSETDDPIILDKATKEVANHAGTIWTHIVSMRRDDAERMNYNTLEAWKDLVRRRIADIASAQKISAQNICWYAAFHNKESNPHVHIVVYSANPKRVISPSPASKKSEAHSPTTSIMTNLPRSDRCRVQAMTFLSSARPPK